MGANPEVERRVEETLARMSLEQKLDYMGGDANYGSGRAAMYSDGWPEIGVPNWMFADATHGLRGWHLAEHSKGQTALFPAFSVQAATFNMPLIEAVGAGIGKDSRMAGVDMLLAPGGQVVRYPLCGRNFEYAGEDPYLVGKACAAFIRGVQSQGVPANIKHYLGNTQEYDRNNVSSEIGDRALYEIELRPYAMSIREADVASIMTAKNPVWGVPASRNKRLITDILKGELGFKGFVLSDWNTAYVPLATALAGLDLDMPGGTALSAETLTPHVKSGELPEETVDDSVRRILRVAYTYDLLNRGADESLTKETIGNEMLTRQVAEEGMVLLKNENGLLPLDAGSVRKLAVIGPNAPNVARGGGEFREPRLQRNQSRGGIPAIP